MELCILLLFVMDFIIVSSYSQASLNTSHAEMNLRIEYHNPKSVLANGNSCNDGSSDCDVYFVVWLKEFDIFKGTHKIISMISTSTKENVQHFETVVTFELKDKLPWIYLLEIKVYDKELKKNDNLIVDANGIFKIRKMNEFQSVPLRYTHENAYFSLKSDVNLSCNENYFGKQCERFCDKKSRIYTCNNEGNIICNTGRYGDLCEFIDYCYLNPCPPSAECKNVPAENSRFCICHGFYDSNCHMVIDPCQPSPCRNNGTCHLNENGDVNCKCKESWTGEYCTKPLPRCLLDTSDERYESKSHLVYRNCSNGGRCYFDTFDSQIKCDCSAHWIGPFCEQPNILLITLISVAFIIVIFTMIGLGLFYIKRYSRQDRKQTYEVVQVNPPEIPAEVPNNSDDDSFEKISLSKIDFEKKM